MQSKSRNTINLWRIKMGEFKLPRDKSGEAIVYGANGKRTYPGDPDYAARVKLAKIAMQKKDMNNTMDMNKTIDINKTKANAVKNKMRGIEQRNASALDAFEGGKYPTGAQSVINMLFGDNKKK